MKTMTAWLICFTLFCTVSLSAQNVTASSPVVSAGKTGYVARSVGETSAQDGPANVELNQWLKAFDSADSKNYSIFLNAHYPTGTTRLALDSSLRNNTGGFDLWKIEENTPTTITALLKERAGDEFARIVLKIDSREPHHIQQIELVPIPRPVDFSPPHMSRKDLIASLRRLLADSVASDRFSGAVLVAQNGKSIFEQAYGFTDREHGIPNTLETRFGLASMSKMLTGVAILQLVQSGKVKLNAPLNTYLPNYPNKTLAAKVTIGELLTNTGGTGDIWGPVFNQHHSELATLEGFVKVYGSRPLLFEPGSRWEYSNYGFMLLGRVIEIVSGETYYDYMRKHIFDPAGMKFTGSESECKAPFSCAVGYTKRETRTLHRADDSFVRGTAANGGYSTVGDLLRFANALRENKLLNQHYTEVLTTAKVKNPMGFFDAYGFGVQVFNGAECFGHNGAGEGVNGDLEICHDPAYVVISLANFDPPAAQQISEFILDRLPARGSTQRK